VVDGWALPFAYGARLAETQWLSSLKSPRCNAPSWPPGGALRAHSPGFAPGCRCRMTAMICRARRTGPLALLTRRALQDVLAKPAPMSPNRRKRVNSPDPPGNRWWCAALLNRWTDGDDRAITCAAPRSCRRAGLVQRQTCRRRTPAIGAPLALLHHTGPLGGARHADVAALRIVRDLPRLSGDYPAC
jgi:hypothetical protein